MRCAIAAATVPPLRMTLEMPLRATCFDSKLQTGHGRCERGARSNLDTIVRNEIATAALVRPRDDIMEGKM